MSVFDELREAVYHVADSWLVDDSGIRRDIRTEFDAFEAAHPGLVDKTQLCENCGEPMPHYYGDGSGGPRINPGWSFICTQVGEKYDPFYFGEDEAIWLVCPACAMEAEG